MNPEQGDDSQFYKEANNNLPADNETVEGVKKRRFRLPKFHPKLQLITGAIFVVIVAGIGVKLLFFSHAAGYYGPGGTYTQWNFPNADKYDSLEWTFMPFQNPPESLTQAGHLHYYAMQFWVVNSTSALGGGYAGLQSDGHFNGTHQGQVVNFSIWGSNGAKSDGLVNLNNTESGGAQIMYKFPWTVGHKYKFQLKEGPSGVDSSGKWWGIWVTDTNTNVVTFIGEQRVAKTIGGNPSIKLKPVTLMFGEDTTWNATINGNFRYTNCDFAPTSSMVAMDITANNGAAKPLNAASSVSSGKVTAGSTGWQTTACPVTVYKNGLNAQHNLGTWLTVAVGNYFNGAQAVQPVADKVAPGVPANLNVSNISNTSLQLNWTGATDNVGVASYDVYRNDTLIDTVMNNTFTDAGLNAKTSYAYYVKAKDAAGNTGSASANLTVSTLATALPISIQTTPTPTPTITIPANPPTVKLGSSGTAVKALQQSLNFLNYGTLTGTGYFGTLTDTAVRKFQKAHSLTVDGVVGPNTWRALRTAMGQ